MESQGGTTAIIQESEGIFFRDPESMQKREQISSDYRLLDQVMNTECLRTLIPDIRVISGM